MGQAIEAYLDAKAKRCKASTLVTTRFRLVGFFADEDAPLASLTRKRCERLYHELTERQRADTYLNTLSEARRFLAWCVGKRWLKLNPLQGVKGEGRRSKGKLQLHVDEARKFLVHAFAKADAGDEGALASLCALLVGLRASEIAGLRVRDIDDDGRLIWAADTDGKTAASRRQLRVDDALAWRLRALAGNRDGGALLWSEVHTRNWPRQATKRLCREAGVPEVTAHGLRGTMTTLGLASGVPLIDISRFLGHEDVKVTQQHYAAPGSAAEAARALGLAVLRGGK